MFLEGEIRETVRRLDEPLLRLMWLVTPSLPLLFVLILYEGWLNKTTREMGMTRGFGVVDWLLAGAWVYFLVSFAISMAPGIRAQLRNRRHCPSCDANLTRQLKTILLTRSCPACNKQIIKGDKVRRLEVAKRYQRRKSDRASLIVTNVLVLNLVLAGACLVAWEGLTWSQRGESLILAPLVGGVALIFASLGYYQWRRWWFLLEMFAAIAVGVLGSVLYWCF